MTRERGDTDSGIPPPTLPGASACVLYRGCAQYFMGFMLMCAILMTRTLMQASGTPGIMEMFAKNMMAKSDTRGDIPREMQLMRSALEALDTAESPLADSIRNMLKADESSPGNLDQAGETAAKSILGGGAAGQ